MAAAQEERFTRKKHDPAFPHHALATALRRRASSLSELDAVVFYDKPFLKFERLLETYLAFAPRGFRSFRMAMPLWLREKLFQKDLLHDELEGSIARLRLGRELLFSEHHLSHAASAFFPSPVRRGAVLTMDGVGEWATTSARASAAATTSRCCGRFHFPHSLGLLYSAFTYYTGFKVNSGEYKLMGLAPYGEPRFAQPDPRQPHRPQAGRLFRLDQSLFRLLHRAAHDERASSTRCSARPAAQARDRCSIQFHMDVAASIQAVTEEIVLRLTRVARDRDRGAESLSRGRRGAQLRGQRQSAARRQLRRALGPAGRGRRRRRARRRAGRLSHLHWPNAPNRPPRLDGMKGAYLGPAFAEAEIERALTAAGARYSRVLDDDGLLAAAVRRPRAEKALGWFQGRMEFGPRALGARSILADARSPAHAVDAQPQGEVPRNRSARSRRPCCARKWPNGSISTATVPYMLLVADVRARPALDDRRRRRRCSASTSSTCRAPRSPL